MSDDDVMTTDEQGTSSHDDDDDVLSSAQVNGFMDEMASSDMECSYPYGTYFVLVIIFYGW